MLPTFSISEALSFGWKKTIENVWFLAGFTLAVLILSFAFDRVDGGWLATFFFRTLNVLLSYLATFVLVKISLQIYKGEKPTVKDIFEIDFHLFLLYLIAILASTILAVIGFMFLVIPGIYIMIRLSLFHFALIEDKLRPIAALKKSLDVTRYTFWRMLLLTLALGLINIAGIIVFGVGLLVTVPMSILTLAYVYEKLKPAQVAQAAESASVPPVAPVTN